MKSQAVVISILLSANLTFSALAIHPKEDPQTVDAAIKEIKLIFNELNLQFRSNVSNDEIIFGLQHTLADQRQPESEKGKKFDATPEYLSKVVRYYRNFANVILTNKSDKEIIWIYAKILQDLTIYEDESSYSVLSKKEIQARNKQVSRGYFIAENRQDHLTEVNTDPMLLAKDKDGMNEGIGFSIDGKDLIFMKQYLASLLEVVKK